MLKVHSKNINQGVVMKNKDKTLTDKITDELKIMGASLVPFASIYPWKNPWHTKVIENVRNFSGKPKKFKDVMKRRDALYMLFSAVITFGTIGLLAFGTHYYASNTIKYGFDSSKWEAIQDSLYRQEEIQRKLDQQNIYRIQFRELDKNKDGVIDSLEFIYR